MSLSESPETQYESRSEGEGLIYLSLVSQIRLSRVLMSRGHGQKAGGARTEAERTKAGGWGVCEKWQGYPDDVASV